MDEYKIFEIVTKAQETFFNQLAEVRKESQTNVKDMQQAMVDSFNRAHDENKKTLEKLSTLFTQQNEKVNERISSLERWRAGILAVLVLLQAAWVGFLAWITGSNNKGK